MAELYNPDGQHENSFDPLKITERECERREENVTTL